MSNITILIFVALKLDVIDLFWCSGWWGQMGFGSMLWLKHIFYSQRSRLKKKKCFAISVISIIESLYKIIYGNDITIELEEILYCHPHNFSNGGLGDFCLGYLMTHGLR